MPIAGRVLEADVRRAFVIRSSARPDGGVMFPAASFDQSTIPFYDWGRLMDKFSGVEFRGMRAAVRALTREAGMDPRAAVARSRRAVGRQSWRGSPVPRRFPHGAPR